MHTDSANLPQFVDKIASLIGPPDVTVAVSSTTGATATLLTIPDGQKFHDLEPTLEKYATRPRFLKEAATIYSTASLTAYALRFKTADSALFVYPAVEKPWLRLIVDYHQATGPNPAPVPAHRQHTASYSFPLSDEIQAWRAAEETGLMDGDNFAWFIDKHLNDIANAPVNWMMAPQDDVDRICRVLNLRDDHQPRDSSGQPIPFDQLEKDLDREPDELPTGYRTRLDKLRAKRFGTQQQLLTLSTEMSVRSSSSTKQTINLQNGARVLEFAEDNEAHLRGQKIKVPDLFLIDIPLFEGEERRLMPVRLFYRKQGSGIKWAIQLVDHRRMVKEAVADAATRVATDTGIPLFQGNPTPGN